MKKLISLQCTKCGAQLNISEEREIVFCEYCGNKMLIDDTSKITFHHIDEAKIRKVEALKELQLKEYEFTAKKISNYKKALKYLFFTPLFAFILIFIYFLGDLKSEDAQVVMEYFWYFAFVVGLAIMYVGLAFVITTDEVKKVIKDKADIDDEEDEEEDYDEE